MYPHINTARYETLATIHSTAQAVPRSRRTGQGDLGDFPKVARRQPRARLLQSAADTVGGAAQ